MFQFNSRGLLVPNTNILSTVQEMKQEFVIAFDNERRRAIYKNYETYSNNLKNILRVDSIKQWIDGSFVTMKPNPNDIDLITFIDGPSIDALGSEMDKFKYPLSLKFFDVDAYIVKTYDLNDSRYALYYGDMLHWMDTFDKAKVNRNGQKLAKGFLEIIY